MKQQVHFILLMFFLSSSFAENCKPTSDKVLINLEIATDTLQNDFSGKDFEGMVSPNIISLEFVEGWISEASICVKADQLAKSAIFNLPDQKLQKTTLIYLASTSDLFIALGDIKEKAYIQWQATIYATDGLLEKNQKDSDWYPACVLQNFTMDNKHSIQMLPHGYVTNIQTKTMPLNECQGSQTLYGENFWNNAKIGNTNVWNLSLSFIKLPSNSLQQKSLGEKTKQFFENHPVSEDAKKRFIRK